MWLKVGLASVSRIIQATLHLRTLTIFASFHVRTRGAVATCPVEILELGSKSSQTALPYGSPAAGDRFIQVGCKSCALF
ncbi:hypothetical protein VFPFJ_03477 [Purpureocillium lilacinum]|uniref:Uncharacterized protein n=1 Tax=Purpureocillium lilacinum TaxID=33203 RepID=A0A179HN43_PURLI|nr:hypothetical protein VFPFJ_03477 [Purpureocillium lilacinum]OAQ91737.1 hypothetical protein VFPFJ_03477 [Purpureocillium lilacinum]